MKHVSYMVRQKETIDHPAWAPEIGMWLDAEEFAPTPDNYNHIICAELIIDDYWPGMITEYTSELNKMLAGRRWARLSFGEYPVPDGMPTAVAVVLAELLWFSMLWDITDVRTTDSPLFFPSHLLKSVFLDAIDDRPRYKSLTWRDFYKHGKKYGLDYQMEAFSAGVPIEYIIQDVKSV